MIAKQLEVGYTFANLFAKRIEETNCLTLIHLPHLLIPRVSDLRLKTRECLEPELSFNVSLGRRSIPEDSQISK